MFIRCHRHRISLDVPIIIKEYKRKKTLQRTYKDRLLKSMQLNSAALWLRGDELDECLPLNVR